MKTLCLTTWMAWMVLLSTAIAEPPIHFKNGITVYEGVVTHHLPDFVYDLDGDEWYEYAMGYNERAMAHNRSLAHGHDPANVRTWTETNSSGWSRTRFGGGVGAGGYGGNGGYDGYLDSGSGGGGGGGYFFGSGRPGNSMQSTYGSTARTYNGRYEYPSFNGGDVELLNPYVLPVRPVGFKAAKSRRSLPPAKTTNKGPTHKGPTHKGPTHKGPTRIHMPPGFEDRWVD